MSNQKPTSWYAKRYTDVYGIHLIPVKANSKLPLLDDWGNKTISDPVEAEQYFKENPNLNLGMSLGPSNLCSLDIDEEDSFQIILGEFGIDASDLWKCPTIQGASKGRRIVFRVPEGVNLPYTKLNWKREDDQTKSYTVFELRTACDGKSRYDMLPPSIHPDTGEPYKWLTQPPKPGTPWPTPPEWLLAIWTSWDTFKPQLQQACPWLPVPEYKPEVKRSPQNRDGQPSVIDAFNEAHDLTAMLDAYGYKKRGNRWLSPHSGTNIAGVNILPDGQRCYIHHASDPLCSTESGQPVGAFDLFCYYDHGGDTSKAVKAAAKLLGLDSRKTAAAPAVRLKEDKPDSSETIDMENSPSTVGVHPFFKCLGYGEGKYYFLPSKGQQVVELTPASMTKYNLLRLAGLEWWESISDGNKIDWDCVVNMLIRQCEEVGLYDRRKERGRGAWYDAGKPVLHLGEELIVNGKRMAIFDHHSKFIYTKQNKMENVFNAEPATDEDCKKVADIFRSMNWSKPEHGMLALGWCVLAPVCGALSWRPHVWLTGGRGTGKSWAQSEIMKHLVGEGTIVHCQGGSTEAGIRQALRSDARPVMFDEAESEDASAARRMQSVLELARQASSDTGAEIVKGTSSGEGMTFNVRSMFMMASINVSLKQAADESRFSVISLNPHPNNKEQSAWFADFQKRVSSTLKYEFCASIRSRTYHLIPTIRHNALLLAQAVAEVLGSQRMGDQVGSLLAGAFSITYSPNMYTIEECRELVKGMDFGDAEQARDESDELACINEIMQHSLRVEKTGGGAADRSIGELIEISHSGFSESGICAEIAKESLLRVGIRVEGNSIWVANRHRALSSILRDTPWGSGHNRLLMRIKGAEPGGRAAKFAGAPSKFVSIPISSVQQ